MAKSRETYNKKEKEKQRLKKKQEKEEKKEARKANSNKDGDFENMLAYVDENGNISSTPPDPSRKKSFDHKNIQIGIARQEESESVDTVRSGTVTYLNESKGYGFIKDSETQDSVFMHVKGWIDQIKERDKVTFEVEMTAKGPSAIEVKLRK